VKYGTITLSQNFNVVHGRSKGAVVTSSWRAGVRGDLALQPTFGVYAQVNYERNVFAGLNSRIGNTIGLTAQVVKSARDKLSVEGGISLTAQRGVAGKGRDLDFLGGRAATSFSHQLSNKASLSQVIELLPNFRQSEDLRINTESLITAPITKQVSVRLSFVVRYDGLPEPGFLSTDRLFTSGIQVSL
jgi:putative salt-induced outer membrane protein YdiY